jgi:hypothetical protein
MKVNEIYIDNWEDYLRFTLSSDYTSWGFRGQSVSSWPVQSTLARYLKNYNVNQAAWAHQEERIIRIFKRKAHHFLKNIPDDDDIVQWLSIMQHHGAPTRLVDFTWSPFVAAYFALHRATETSAVWAVYPGIFYSKDEIRLLDGNRVTPQDCWPESFATFRRLFLEKNIPFAVQGEPHAMNDRLIAQAGTFVIPSVLDKNLEEIFLNYPDSNRLITKFVLNTKRIRDAAMSYMHVTNISDATLFPGIDGMARSLAYELEYHWAYDPKTMRKVNGYRSPVFGFPSGIVD